MTGLGGAWRVGFAGAGQAGLWLALGAVAAVLLVLLYRYERRLVSLGAGMGLLALRLLAAGSLVLALLEPVVERTHREEARGRVIVGVDLSESMSLADPTRPEPDARALAAALGLSGAEPGGLPRREVVRRLLAGAWGRRLAEVGDVEVVGFAREGTEPASVDVMAARLAEPAAAGEPSRARTDWRPVLDRALAAADEGPVVGVVLLSDGRENAARPRAGGEPDDPAARLAARGVAVHGVVVGSTIAPRDAAIAAVALPGRTAVGDVVDVGVTVKLDGVEPGARVPVRLERAGAAPEELLVTAGAARPTATFSVPAERAGWLDLTVAVGPIEGDARPDNDRRATRVEVVDDPARVLLVADEAGWELRYLRNALARDRQVSLDAVVLRQSGGADPDARRYLDALPEATAGGSGADALNAYDLIIVGDVAASPAWPGDGWTRLRSYVDERGGTLVIGAGPRGSAALAADPVAGAMLPVTASEPLEPPAEAAGPLPGGVLVGPSATAPLDAWPMLRLAADAAADRAAWDALPRFPSIVAGRPKPTATPLLVARDAPDAVADGPVVAAAMPFGLGQVFWIGTDATWRWRLRVGDAHHHRFWGQVVRWATAARLAAGNEVVRFGPTRPRVVEGWPVAVRARVSDARAAGLMAARIFRARGAGTAPLEASPSPEAARPPTAPEAEGEAVAVVALRPSPTLPGVFEGGSPGLPAGSYVVRLDAPELPGAPDDLAGLEVEAEAGGETVELAASRDALAALAAPGGGLVAADFEADRVLDRLTAVRRERTRVETIALGERPEALVLFLGLVGLEWFWRKRLGLA